MRIKKTRKNAKAKNRTSRGSEGIDSWMKQQENTANMKLKEAMKTTIDDWITNNKSKKRKRKPPITSHYTIPKNEIEQAINKNNLKS